MSSKADSDRSPESLNVRDAIEVLPRIVFSAVGCCYVAGFVILNVHLGRHGLVRSDFLEARYVSAGALWLFVTASSYYFSIFFSARLRDEFAKHHVRSKRIWAVAMEAFVLTSAAIVFLSILSDGQLNFFSREKVGQTLGALSALILNAVGIRQCFMGWRQQLGRYVAFNPESRAAANAHADGPPVFIKAFILLSGLSFYATSAFPLLSPAFGGGRLESVVLIVRPDAIDAMRALHLEPNPETRVVGPLELIFESADDFVLVPMVTMKGTKSVRIRKELVDVVSYERRFGGPPEAAMEAQP
jgi:hypothetical protein